MPPPIKRRRTPQIIAIVAGLTLYVGIVTYIVWSRHAADFAWHQKIDADIASSKDQIKDDILEPHTSRFSIRRTYDEMIVRDVFSKPHFTKMTYDEQYAVDEARIDLNDMRIKNWRPNPGGLPSTK
jgi:hypothetical protein